MKFNKENKSAEIIFELCVWAFLLYFSYTTNPILLIGIVTAMFLSYKISSLSKKIKHQTVLLEKFEKQSLAQQPQDTDKKNEDEA